MRMTTVEWASKGSRRWLQLAVNRRPDPLLQALRRSGAVPSDASVTWHSPLEGECFKEYRDGEALKRAGIAPNKLRKPLNSFWPARGPVWDAIGAASDGSALFLEAKAHIPEAATPGTKASPESLISIKKSLQEARRFYAPQATAKWCRTFYQYANRLAHHYFLTKANGLQSRLVFLYFVNAHDVEGPASEHEWHGAIRLIHAALGLPKDLRSFGVFDAFLDVNLLRNAAGSV